VPFKGSRDLWTEPSNLEKLIGWLQVMHLDRNEISNDIVVLKTTIATKESIFLFHKNKKNEYSNKNDGCPVGFYNDGDAFIGTGTA
jgi:hypothetical protein